MFLTNSATNFILPPTYNHFFHIKQTISSPPFNIIPTPTYISLKSISPNRLLSIRTLFHTPLQSVCRCFLLVTQCSENKSINKIILFKIISQYLTRLHYPAYYLFLIGISYDRNIRIFQHFHFHFTFQRKAVCVPSMPTYVCPSVLLLPQKGSSVFLPHLPGIKIQKNSRPAYIRYMQSDCLS